MSREYWNGIDKFLKFAYTGRLDGSFVSWPCRRCENRYNYSRASVNEEKGQPTPSHHGWGHREKYTWGRKSSNTRTIEATHASHATLPSQATQREENAGHIRDYKGHYPEIIRESQRRRFASVKLADKVIDLDKEWQQHNFDLIQCTEKINAIDKKKLQTQKGKSYCLFAG